MSTSISKFQFYLYFWSRRLLFLPLIPFIELNHRLGELGQYRGIRITDVNLDDSDDALFLDMVTEALKLIEKNDLRRFERVCRHVNWIVNSELLSLGRYQRIFRVCYLDFLGYGVAEEREKNVVRLALTIIHEATHGHIFAKHVAYTKSLRIRIERLCRLEEERFLEKLDRRWKEELSEELKFDPRPWIDSWQQKISERFRSMLKRIDWSRIINVESRALAAKEVGNHRESLELFEKAYQLRERDQGRSHPDVWMSRLSIAGALMSLERYSEAETIYQHILSLQKDQLGELHEDTLVTKQNLGVLFYEIERYAEAEQLHREVIAARESQFGKNHSSTLNSVYSLGVLLKEMGRCNEAVLLFERVIEGGGDQSADLIESARDLLETIESEDSD
ncbi:MAG: tetratricopeptide repeat protein [Verrucomicrobiota bacterium]